MTITQQEIIALAVEAGFDDITPWLDAENVEQGQIDAANRRIERMTAFAALASASAGKIDHDQAFARYRAYLNDRSAQQIKEAYQRGVRDEREAAAKLCEEIYTNGDGAEGWLQIAANRIRARNKEST